MKIATYALSNPFADPVQKNDEILIVTSFYGSPQQFRLAYSGYLKLVELQWVTASLGQVGILEAVIHGR